MNDSAASTTADATAASQPSALASPRLLVPLALAGVYLIWGSTYLGIRIALAGYPPFLMAAIRFLIAGAVLFFALRARGMPAPTARQWRNCAVTGGLLLGFGNGMVCYAEQSVASGIAAVAVASVALFAALFAGFYGDWPNRREWIGLVVGFAGVVLLNLGSQMRASPVGALALTIAAASWAFGSAWSRRQNMPPPAMSTAAQMLCGGAVLSGFALIAGERIATVPSLAATAALVYLIVAGSILGFSAYIYLLQHVRPALATSYAYVNPPVAVLVGVLLAGEQVRPLDLVGMLVILAGVAAITLAKAKR
jgi:drug/metabolite transporter (DMT)-like permease